MKKVQEHIEQKLLQSLHDFLEEMGADRALKRINSKANFDSDLGIDSLGRIEFMHRVEEVIGHKLPTNVFVETQNIHDILQYVTRTIPEDKLSHFNTVTDNNDTPTTQIVRGRSLVDSFLTHASLTPDRTHIYLTLDDGSEKPLTYGYLYKQAKKVAAGLVSKGLNSHETVAIMLPTSEDFFISFMGVLLAGGIPVPIYPPFRPSHLEEYVLREAKLLQNAGAKFLITFPQAQLLSRMIQGLIPSMSEVITVEKLKVAEDTFTPAVVLPTDPAFIQYTSGSTGNPKGVLLTHENILANLNAAGEALDVTGHDRIVSWLPLYHDMGLIGCWFGSLYFGIPLAIMSPLNFISRPESWLWAIHHHKGTLTAAPNFAFELCIRRVKESDIEGLDLSSMRAILNGAEAIHAETLQRFIAKFEPYGFKANSMYPVYGLAESTVALAFPPLGRNYPRIDRINKERLENEGIAEKTDTNFTSYVGCGDAIPGHEIKIVNKQGHIVPDRTVGRLLFRGPSSMQGYFNNPEATERIMFDGWIDSGDFAYFAEGDVFITGRAKDVIIKAGKNIYPDDIEDITGKIPGIKKGRVIAFGIEDKASGTEKLIIVAETMETDSDAREKISAAVLTKLVTDLGIPADEIILARPGTIPKTSSGKLQRSACKQAYLDNTLQKKSLPVWAQFARISVRSYWEKIKKVSGKLKDVIFTLYAALVAIFIVVSGFLIIALTTKKTGNRVARFFVKGFFSLCFIPIKTIGYDKLLKHRPIIYVANHTSYIDALIMTAVLPHGFAAVGKREIVSFKPFAWLWNKLGHLTVERQDITQGLNDLKLMEEKLHEGTPLLIFPEGTFSSTKGLLPFKTGAFKLAVDTQTPICPISITGARNLLPDGSFLLTRHQIDIAVHTPIKPEGQDWAEVLRLSNLAKREIAKATGEDNYQID